MATDGVAANDSRHYPKLIVGLGNPGRQYEGTRHNIGFDVLDQLVACWGGEFKSEARWRAAWGKCGQHYVLKPMTYMNLSGEAVRGVSRYFQITPAQILVIYDDVALPLGQLRFRLKGSAGGHNGVKSIIQHLGSEHFPRLKIGIERSEGRRQGGLKGHVLGKFSPDERDVVQNVLEQAVRAVQVAVSEGVEVSANEFNSRRVQRPRNEIDHQTQ